MNYSFLEILYWCKNDGINPAFDYLEEFGQYNWIDRRSNFLKSKIGYYL
jgi:hypothetical protein